MNQGIVFSQGRISAQLAMIPRYPRYEGDLLRSEQDLVEMIGNYVQPDGGTLEGPGYWMFTFNECVSAFYALARFHKKPFTQYRDVFGSTGRYELSMLSMEGDRTILHAINDAHPGVHVSCTLASAFYQFTGEAAWKNLYERLIAQGCVDEDTFSLIAAPLPDGIMLPEPELDRFFPVTGKMGIVRQGEDLLTRVHLCSGPTCNTHFDEDKGSVVLEADGHIISPDCGCANYCESELTHLHDAKAHSLLCPVNASGVKAEQGIQEAGGKVFLAEREGSFAEFASDDTAAWSNGVYEQVGRRVTTPIAELTVLEDTFRLGSADYVNFQLNSYGQWQTEKGMAKTQVGEVTLRVIPLNWKWEEARVRPMMDGEHRPVFQLCASYKEKRAGRLLTAVCMEKSKTICVEAAEDGWHFTQGERSFHLEEGEERCRWLELHG